ncbi:uncharacterized protein LOC134664729 [Cydia fagiglandana]|uniref:uncharacterized protein LOC134664729 n=1 Tax=Cydia fagiglandana TaxID=1458189 RepID=UPI002FEE263E
MSTSETLKSLITLQQDNLEVTEKAHVNFKKSPKERITIGYVQGRLETLENNYKEFKTIHQRLITGVSKEDKCKLSYFTEDLYDTFEERYYMYKGELKTVLQKFNAEIKDNQVIENSSGNQASNSEIKLPRITIPTFSGEYTEWQSFHDLFNTLIHKNSSLDDVQRMHYLKVNLKGDAEYLLRQFSITAENYQQAWNILKKRYDNKRYIANCHFKRFFGQRTIVKESATALKQLLDTSVECLNSLKNLGLPITQWDAIVIYIIVSKLDPDSHKHWEELINGEDSSVFPTFERLKSFLETRFRTLEMVEPDNKSWKPAAPRTFHVTASDTCLEIQCAFCKEDHYIFNCKQFAKQPLDDRYNFVRENNLCFNCLIPNHAVWRCRQKSSCQVCKRRHHSLLHRDSKPTEEMQENNKVDTSLDDSKVVAHVRPNEEATEKNIMLATALVDVTSKCGQPQMCRAFIDPGSEISFVAARVVEMLNLKKTTISGVVSGIEEGSVCIKNKVELQISSRYEPDFVVKVNAYVLKSITRSLPAREVNCEPWPQLDDAKLADPTFNIPGRVDILLGADVYGKILESGFMKGPGYLVAQYTRLGWIVTGDTNTTSSRPSKHASFHVIRQVEEDNNLLKRFWEVETQGYTNMKGWSKEEELCEEIYKTTTTRDDTGRYIVHLPLKESVEDTVKSCGETKQQATLRFKQLERKFEKNYHLKKEYAKVIHEYLELGHMKRTEVEDDAAAVYLPHHAVVKETRDTTKVRVVFDASAKGSRGVSLNNAMMIGPTLQPGLRSLVIRWRAHRICVIGDIVKMYRQVWMTDEHTDLQRIVWRDTPSEKIESYKLLTVTFGTAAAPYLAVRTLNQLADDEAHIYPRAASIVKNSFYMDDLMTGHEDKSEIKKLCQDINCLLKAGGFEMQKWSSNSEELLEFLRNGRTCEESENKIEIKLDKVIKILGLTWDRKEDVFKITVNLPNSRIPTTKRQIISEVASLFDPFGWLAPVIITAKVMIQRLWLYNLSWDDELPPEVVEEWRNYREELSELQSIQIPRWIKITSRSKDIQLHGFADASSLAYAGVVYLRVTDENDIIHISMLAAKTKVSPLKQLTIPRLELCAAVLTAKLLREMADLLQVSMDNVYAWTDSMVVLSWLQSQPSRWQLFVGNRVSDIIQLIDQDKWRHVPSADNPADLASRGVSSRDMADSDIWWTGPKWLRYQNIDFERTKIPSTDLEMRKTFHILQHKDLSQHLEGLLPGEVTVLTFGAIMVQILQEQPKN